MTEPAAKHCPFCEKQGLPILPLRYAVARTDFDSDHPSWKALDLPSTFGQGVTDIALPGNSAKYTARLLRPGYLYVFNEVRGEWTGYLVTGQGFLYEFDVEDVTPPNADTIEFSCYRTGEEYIARCITIPDAANAGAVWLGFSDTAWTSAVLEKHRSASYREKHMRKIDVSGGYVGEQHTAALTELAGVVNEFAEAGPVPGAPSEGRQLGSAVNPDTGEATPLYELPVLAIYSYPTFDYSPHEFSGLKHETPGLIEWASQAAGALTPMLVAVDDPIGIAAELNELVKKRAVEWAEEPERKRKHQSALMIGAVRQAVENGAELQEAEDRKNAAGLADAFSRVLFGTAYRKIVGPSDEVIERAGRIREEDLTAIHADAWDKYEEMYDEPARESYLNDEYPAALAALEAQTLNPLDDAYLYWLRSPSFRQHFVCNYDPADVECGIGYTQAMLFVLLDASGRKTVADYLDACLQADPAQPEAVELRAMAFNQDALIQHWATSAAAGAQEEDGPFGWDAMADAVFSGFKNVLHEATGGSLSGPMSNLATYAYEFSGPFLRRLNHVFDVATGAIIAQLPEKRVIALLGAVAKAENPHLRLMDLRTAPNRQQATRMVARAVAAISGTDELALRSGVRQSLDDFFDPLDGARYPFQGIMLVDESQAGSLAAMQSSGSRDARAQHLTCCVLRPERFSLQVEYTARRLVNLEVKTSFVSALLAVWSMSSAWAEVRKKPGLKSTAGFASGLAAFSSAALEGSGAALRSVPWGAARLTRPLALGAMRIATRAELLGFSGRLIGVVGGVVAGALAVWEGKQEWLDSPVYAVSIGVLGVSMAALSVAIFLGFISTGIGLLVAIVIAIIMYAVGFLKKNAIEKWLDRALVFGKSESGERYGDLAAQLAGMGQIGTES